MFLVYVDRIEQNYMYHVIDILIFISNNCSDLERIHHSHPLFYFVCGFILSLEKGADVNGICPFPYCFAFLHPCPAIELDIRGR